MPDLGDQLRDAGVAADEMWADLTQRLLLLTDRIVRLEQAEPAPEPEPEPEPEPVPTGVRVGVYRGPGQFAQPIEPYESFIGKPVDFVLDFQAADNVGNRTWPDWQANRWAGRNICLGSTLIFPTADWGRGGWTWQRLANGEMDGEWRTLAQRLVAKGHGRAILRGNHEFNGGWFVHRVNNGEEAAFVAAWRRWHGIMKSTPGAQFEFSWNPIIEAQSMQDPTRAWPGDAYVDHVAIDVYDGWYGTGWIPGVNAAPSQAQRDAMWNANLNGAFGIKFWSDFARAHGKPLAFPEWGLRTWKEADGKCHGGGDNPSFIHRMFDLFADPAHNVAYHAFWEDPADGGWGVFDPDATVNPTPGQQIPVPLSRAAFRDRIRG